MNFQGIRPDLVKYEMRKTSGEPAWAKPVKKPGFFGRLLSGLGRIVGAVAAPLSFVFPPAALAAAGMYGLAQVGDQIQYRAYARMQQQQADQSMQNVSFPGLEGAMGGGGLHPASQTPITPQQERVMNVLFARDDASSSMAHRI